MQLQMIHTKIGPIAVYVKVGDPQQIPLIMLHGVYFDHRMWESQVSQIHDRTVIVVDMPLHGASRQLLKSDWTLDDCALMLLDLLRELNIGKVIAVGQSWGSMTIVRAAHLKPEVFQAVGLCNLRFKAETFIGTWLVHLRHFMLPFNLFTSSNVAWCCSPSGVGLLIRS